MYIPIELQKENRFQDVAIPANSVYFGRLGEVSPKSLLYSGDDLADPNITLDDQVQMFEQYCEEQSNKE